MGLDTLRYSESDSNRFDEQPKGEADLGMCFAHGHLPGADVPAVYGAPTYM